ncbi:MAG: chemotaxis protein CheA [Gammaproteobacteria bacterium]|nr:chemotaxis protein CheA [Gammaproteobacteria bacterium]
MSIDLDDEILQDFLVEAGEILELLGEQLVDLEQNPEDTELLNAIFRGFHTIKGGAGFLAIEVMVETCHVAEDIFNLLRQGERVATPELMDVILQALDVVNIMFNDIQSGNDPVGAEQSLLDNLRLYAVPGDSVAPAAEAVVAPEPEPEQEPEIVETEAAATELSSEDITDDEFENLLDELHGKGKHGGNPKDDEPPVAKSTTDSSELITDDEFEDLLDQLHGNGKPGAVKPAPDAAKKSSSDELITDDEFEDLLDQLHGSGKPGDNKIAAPEPPKEDSKNEDNASSDSELITDDEFENLLDEMHGKGVGPTSTNVTSASAAAVKAEKPAPVAAAPAAAPKKTTAPAAAKGETTVRVDTERLDDIMNLVGELVLVRNRLGKLQGDLDLGDSEMGKAISNLDIVTADLQTSVMKTRMQPIKKVFGRFPRVIRDLARSLKKDISLEMIGEETDLDKNLVEALADPLVHLVRNSVDHGIEMPDERERVGKPRQGTVILAAEQEGDHILLSIEDDGAGMDPDLLRDLVVKKGLMDRESASRLEDKECFNLIFMPGFSTKEQISDISGRGVGMDVVKTRITQLNGHLDIDSELGKGTKLSIKVPLTLAILPTLMVKLGQHAFALPLSMVREIIEMETKTPNIIDGQPVIMVREKAVPVFYLSKWLLPYGETSDKGEGEGQVIIIQMGTQTVGIVVDMVIGQEEVVIKPLGAFLSSSIGFAGSTITGDGGIALILDLGNLFKHRAVKGF